MGDKSKIEWTDATWSPVRGCSMVSPGCTNCYAMRNAHRWPQFGKLTRPGPNGMVWTGEVRGVTALLHIPFSWTAPRLVFVNSQSDTFHADVATEFLDHIFAVMLLCPQHIFQVLTKRADRMLAYCSSSETAGRVVSLAAEIASRIGGKIEVRHEADGLTGFQLPNVWLGVSVENQDTAHERMPLLLKTPAAVRFLSMEPLLGPVSFRWAPYAHTATGETYRKYLERNGSVDHLEALRKLDWVIVGGESGPRARPADLAWIRSIVDQCTQAAVPVFVKQLGARPYDTHPEQPSMHRELRPRDRKGGDPFEWPDDLRIRQFPKVNQHEEAKTAD